MDNQEKNVVNTDGMKTSDFYFDLPEELIAQDPLLDRSSSKLLMLDQNTGETKHETFKNIADYLSPGDCLVLNNTKVIPARLIGNRETGGQVEVLLLKRHHTIMAFFCKYNLLFFEPLSQKHCITETKETISFLYCFFIGI